MNNIKLISTKTINLKKKQIISICKLKNTYWNWSISNQLKWFKKNVRKNDINNILELNGRLVGYTLLRRRKAIKEKKIINYYYFDTMIINKKFRKKGYGKILMEYNNKVLKNLKDHAFLTCLKKHISFYKKNNWKILPKNNFKLMDHKPAWFKNKKDLFGMIFGSVKKNNKKIYYFLNKI